MWLYTGGRGEPMNPGVGGPPTGKLEFVALGSMGLKPRVPSKGCTCPAAIGFPTGIGEVTCFFASSRHTQAFKVPHADMMMGPWVCPLEGLCLSFVHGFLGVD